MYFVHLAAAAFIALIFAITLILSTIYYIEFNPFNDFIHARGDYLITLVRTTVKFTLAAYLSVDLLNIFAF